MPNFQEHHARSHKRFFELVENPAGEYRRTLIHKATHLSCYIFSDTYLIKALRLHNIAQSEFSQQPFGRFSCRIFFAAITMPPHTCVAFLHLATAVASTSLSRAQPNTAPPWHFPLKPIVTMNQLQAMRVFLKVAENGSFGRAAASLDISNAVVTRYVALLETHLDTRLVNRTTRSLSLTEAGLAYADGCRQLLEQLEAMESSVSQRANDPSGTLKLMAVASFSLFGLTPLLERYRLQCPRVKLSVTLLHRPVDLIEQGFDVGIVVPGQVRGGTLIKRALFKVRSVAVATPAYLAARGMPAAPAQLAAHPLLAPSTNVHSAQWCFVDTNGIEETANMEAIYAVNNAVMLRQAALADMGITILPENHVSADLMSGALVQVLPDYRIKGADKEVSLVYPGRRHVSAKTRSFVEFTVDYFRNRAGPTLSSIFTNS
ncbi:LysR family transcriptional regulator [Paraburkholderia domus]|nr:LysR family transcriptional regulator [Paraburkholderia domus]